MWTSEIYPVYMIQYGPVLPDPDVPGPRYHTVIFVQTNNDGSGKVHHVTGDLVQGMHYDCRDEGKPEESEDFFRKEYLGKLSSTTYPASVDGICSRLPAPPKQKAFNMATMKTEPVKPDGTFYKPGEDRPRLMKCTEWTEQIAIPKLLEAGVIFTI